MMKKLQRLIAMAALVALPMAVGAQTGTTLANSDLPRTFTFEEGSGDDAYLNFANGADGWFIGGATFKDGSQSLYVSDNNGSSYNYSTANVYSYAWVTLDIQESGVYEISFDWKGTGEGSYDYMYVYWAPASVTPTAGSQLSGATQLGSRFNQQSDWTNFYDTRTITDDDLGEYKLIFMWRSDVSIFNNPPAAIDNLYLGKLTCPAPTSLSISNITATDASVSWTSVGDETQWLVYLDGQEIPESPVYEDSITLSGLYPMSHYNVTVRAFCGEGDTSMAVSTSFTTPCDESLYAPIPFFSGFEELNTNESPDCWVQVEIGGNPGLGAVFPSAYRWAPNAHTGSVYFEFESSTGSETEVLALPRMEDVSTLQLSFYAATTTNRNAFTLEAGVIETDDEGNMVFVPVDTVDLYAGPVEAWHDSYRIYNVLFDTYEGNGERLAIRTTPTTGAMYTLMIDDFNVIRVGVPVLGPFEHTSYTINMGDTISLNANLMTGEVETYTWTSPMIESGDAAIVSQDTTNVVILYNAAGIDTVTVTASNASGEASKSVTVNIIDNSLISDYPYSTGFEPGEDRSWYTDGDLNGWYLGTATATEDGGTSLYISRDNGASNMMADGLTCRSYAFRHFDMLTGGEFLLDFWWKGNGTSGSRYLEVYLAPGEVYPVHGNSPSSSWTRVASCYNASDWTEFNDVMEAEAGTNTLIFYWYGTGNVNPPHAVDNITIDKLNCSRIGNLTASSVYAHGATISWTPRSEESEWWVVVDDGDGYAVSDTTLQLSGFDGQTQHTVSVRAICGAGDTSAARTVSFTTTIACPAVSNIHATDVTGSSATIEWTAGGIETAWKLVINGGDTIDVSDEPSYSATGLEALTQYTVTIIADCGDEDGVSTSATGTFITLCDAGTCDVTVDMVDNASDGWNGNSLSFVQNGAPIGSASLASGSTGTATISVCTAYPLSVIFNAGSWTSEVGATIYSGSGAELYSFAAGSMSSSNNGDTLFTATAPCSGCPMPSALQVTNIEETSITISWTDNDTVQGFVVSVDGGDWQAATGNTFTATGLSASTNHNFAVRTLCGADDTSNARTIDVRTLCGSVDVPWTEGFETISSNIDCWTSIHGSSSGIELNTTSSRVHSGSKSLRFNGYAQTPNIAVLPSFSQAISGLEIDMWVLAESSASSGTLRIGYMTDLTDSSTFVSVVDLPAGSYTNYTEVLVNFASAPDSAFIAIAQKNENQNYWWWIDDLSVDVIGTHPDPGTNPGTDCETPTISSVTATESSVELTFTGSAESYEVAIVEGAWSAPANTTTITATTYTFTGLEAGTQYNVGVRAVCDDDATSAWVHQSITTESVELPCTCDVPTNLHQVSAESTSAVIDWTPGENNESWDISVNGSTVNVTTHPATITGLTAGSSNTVRIRAHCCDGETSAWTPDITVTTSGSGEGIDNVSALHIGLTPNPASDVVVLSGAAEGAQVSVVDMNGRTVRTLTANGENVNIDLGGLAAGAYFVRVSDSQNLAIRKLIVK